MKAMRLADKRAIVTCGGQGIGRSIALAYAAEGAIVLKVVAREHVGDGIRCNALCPGTTDAPSLGDRIADTPDPGATRAAFMTGQLLVIDGGQTL